MKLCMFSSLVLNRKLIRWIKRNTDKNPVVCIIPSFPMDEESALKHKKNSFITYGFKTWTFPVYTETLDYYCLKLMKSDVVFLEGGNTFLFQAYLKMFGIFDILKKFAHSENKILIGESAGSIIMCNSIEIAQFADNDIIGSDDKSGLGLVDFSFKPHFDHWFHQGKLFRQYSKEHNCSVYGMFEGGYIIVEDEKIRIEGTAFKYNGNKAILITNE